MVMAVTTPPEIVAVAVAPLPPPPVNVTPGALVYKEPPLPVATRSMVRVDALVIVPFVIDQAYAAPSVRGTEATLPVELAQTGRGAVIVGAGSQTCTSSAVVRRLSNTSDGMLPDTTSSFSYSPVGTLAATFASKAIVSVLFAAMVSPDQTGEDAVPPGFAAGEPLMTFEPLLYVKPLAKLSVTDTPVAAVDGNRFGTLLM